MFIMSQEAMEPLRFRHTGDDGESEMTEKERLLAVLAGEEVDRAPFIGPGGMMTVAITEVMDATGCHWPEAHNDPALMARLGLGMHDLAGVENLGVPFCLTVEAEAMGAPVDLGSRGVEPRITGYILEDVGGFASLPGIAARPGNRADVVLRAIRDLAVRGKDIPITGNLTGPITLATSLIDPLVFFRALRCDPGAVHGLLGFLAEELSGFGRAQVEAGADVVVVADPTGTGEILGPQAFREFALPYINRVVEGLGDKHACTTIVHICGRLQPVFRELNELKAGGLSVDSLVSIRALRKQAPGKVLVGNVSTQLLDQGPPERIVRAGLHCLKGGVSVLAPACGISPNTRLDHIRALASVVKGDGARGGAAGVEGHVAS